MFLISGFLLRGLYCTCLCSSMCRLVYMDQISSRLCKLDDSQTSADGEDIFLETKLRLKLQMAESCRQQNNFATALKILGKTHSVMTFFKFFLVLFVMFLLYYLLFVFSHLECWCRFKSLKCVISYSQLYSCFLVT